MLCGVFARLVVEYDSHTQVISTESSSGAVIAAGRATQGSHHQAIQRRPGAAEGAAPQPVGGRPQRVGPSGSPVGMAIGYHGPVRTFGGAPWGWRRGFHEPGPLQMVSLLGGRGHPLTRRVGISGARSRV